MTCLLAYSTNNKGDSHLQPQKRQSKVTVTFANLPEKKL